MRPVDLVNRACGALLLACSAATFANTFTVVPDASSANLANWNWSISVDGGGSSANPTLVVLTGSTYTFNVATSLSHPFWIDQAPGLGGSVGADPYPYPTDALSDNGLTASGTITMNLPADAPDTLYYACGFHTPMIGTITVVHDLVFRSDFD